MTLDILRHKLLSAKTPIIVKCADRVRLYLLQEDGAEELDEDFLFIRLPNFLRAIGTCTQHGDVDILSTNDQGSAIPCFEL